MSAPENDLRNKIEIDQPFETVRFKTKTGNLLVNIEENGAIRIASERGVLLVQPNANNAVEITVQKYRL